MWNPIKAYSEHREARAAAEDLRVRQEYAEREAEGARETDYIVAMERADTEAEVEQVRQAFDVRASAAQQAEPWTWEQIEAREAEIQETLDWADWTDEIRPASGDEASI